MNDLWDSYLQALRDHVAPPLKSLFAPLDTFLGGLTTDVGRWCAAALLITAGIAVLFVRRDYVYLGAPDRHRWRDLRIWTLFALAPYVFIYLRLF